MLIEDPLMSFTDVKTLFAVVLREIATDIESDRFESENIDAFFQEIEDSIRYQLGRHQGDETKYFTIETRLNNLQSLHQKWEKKKEQLIETQKRVKTPAEILSYL